MSQKQTFITQRQRQLIPQMLSVFPLGEKIYFSLYCFLITETMHLRNMFILIAIFDYSVNVSNIKEINL